eukprot:CAMPEP_0170922664 /NCGR_PEP_ID=MMETSP0735-20130129/10581_1 /TAXON_ID=186038 /ORGANISM="Fragilariopsis kerguelensis, Strain L26-C5" /LENGTH=153 /DNA_ID=CAMNT_0011322113 /DNA_START=1 /DNA_END=463 /DNA_ORIENTATION=+
MNSGIDVFDAGHGCSEEQIQSEIVRIQEEAELKKKEELLARRNEIRKLLQRHSVSMSSLQVQSDKEIRHEENCRAIPEGNEDEDEDEDDNNEGKDNVDDSIQKMTISVSESSMASTNLDDSDSNSNSNSNNDTENGDDRQSQDDNDDDMSSIV